MTDVTRARLDRATEDLRAVLVELDEIARHPSELGPAAVQAVETAKARAGAAMAWTAIAATAVPGDGDGNVPATYPFKLSTELVG